MLLARCLDSRSDFLKTTWDEIAGTSFICFDFVSYQRCFLHSQRSFCSVRLLSGLYPFCCSSFGCLFSFGDMNEYNGYVSVRYNSLFISFLCRCSQKVTKQQREIATFCIFERMWTIRRSIFKMPFSKFDMFCLGYFWQHRQTEWIQILPRSVGWIISRLLIDVTF